jgi:phage terminase small subunit
MSKAKLNPKQQAFIAAYLQSWNATHAAIEAGYSAKTARQQASRLLSNVNVAGEIELRLAQLKMSGNEALARLSDIARGDISDFMTITDEATGIDFEKALKNGKLHLVKKITFGKGKVAFEMYDKQAALNTIAKHHGLLNEKVEIDIKLVGQAVEALEALGQDPAAVFNEIIQRAKLKQDAGH